MSVSMCVGAECLVIRTFETDVEWSEYTQNLLVKKVIQDCRLLSQRECSCFKLLAPFTRVSQKVIGFFSCTKCCTFTFSSMSRCWLKATACKVYCLCHSRSPCGKTDTQIRLNYRFFLFLC
jgi:hypothetical protein